MLQNLKLLLLLLLLEEEEEEDLLLYHLLSERNARRSPRPRRLSNANLQKVNQQVKGHSNIERPYKCKICGMQLKRRNNMKSHMRLHQNQSKTTYKCSLCNKEYKIEQYLRQHEREVHSMQCKLCGEQFEIDHQMKNHLCKGKKANQTGSKATELAGTHNDWSMSEISHVGSSAEGLRGRKLSQDLIPFKCECFMVFLNESEYKKHQTDCEVFRNGLNDVANVEIENMIKEECEVGFVGIKEEFSS